jgi:dihydroneopterin aldolase
MVKKRTETAKQSKNVLSVIRLRNAVFYAYHGVLSDEQNLGGKFEVDVDLHCDLSKGAKSDHLKDTVDYERVYDCIRTIVVGRKFLLLERLGSEIAQGILRQFGQVQRVDVRVRKPGAAVKGVIDHVEVEISHRRS